MDLREEDPRSADHLSAIGFLYQFTYKGLYLSLALGSS